MIDLSCLYWNVRGLNRVTKKKCVQMLVKENNCCLCALQETKVEVYDVMFLRQLDAGNSFMWDGINSMGMSGGLLSGYNNLMWRRVWVEHQQYTITTKLELKGTHFTLCFTNVYGAPDRAGKIHFFQELYDAAAMVDGPWLIGGDFNCTLYPWERQNCVGSRRDTSKFQEWVMENALTGVELTGKKFTWTNRQQIPAMAKLDHCFVNESFLAVMTFHEAHGKSSMLSDHSPIILQARDSYRPRPSLVRMENVWLRMDQFKQILKDTWEKPVNRDIAEDIWARKLQMVKQVMRAWRKQYMRQHKEKKEELVQQIKLLDDIEEVGVLSEGDWEKRKDLRAQLDEVLMAESIYWKQRSKFKWAEAGDANSRFFHKYANGRRKNNTIRSIMHNGTRCETQEDITAAMECHYQEVFGQNEVLRIKLHWQELYELHPQLIQCDQDFTTTEIKQAVMGLGKNKSPGPDGITAEFLQQNWDYVGPDLIKYFAEFCAGRALLDRFSYYYISLVPKKEEAMQPRDYRPIALSNITPKILAKMMATRIKLEMPKLISRNQFAFLQGRCLTDAYMVTSELINWCRVKKEEIFMLKIDFEKAFDKMKWDALWEVLQYNGFSSTWIQWCKSLVEPAKIAILVNGRPSRWIKCRRGVRQGDPLSPYLFILLADVLARSMKKAVRSGLLSTIAGEVFHEPPQLIQYADDTILFCKATEEQARVLKIMLTYFELYTGLKINYDKTGLHYIGSDPMKASGLAQIIGCGVIDLPITYLGLPLAIGKIPRISWENLIGRIHKKLETWKARYFNIAGRIILVNHVVAAIPSHYNSIFLMPQWVSEAINKQCRRFIWFGTDKQGGVRSLVNWSRMCVKREHGGMGVRDINQHNRALLCKWWWRLASKEDTTWRILVHTHYFGSQHWTEAKVTPRWSSIWRSLVKVRDFVDPSIHMCVGNGRHVEFWKDRWHKEFKLCDQFPDLYRSCRRPRGTIAMILEGDFTEEFVGGTVVTEQTLEAFLLICFQLHLTEEEDTIKWRWTTKGMFTVASAYEMLIDGGLRYGLWKSIWKSFAPLKFQIHAWLAVEGKLNTTDILQRKGVQISTICSLCQQETETVQHLFLNCEKTKQLWREVRERGGWAGRLNAPSSFESLFINMPPAAHCSKKAWRSIVQAGLWSIWIARNEVIFQDGRWDMARVRMDWRFLLRTWINCIPLQLKQEWKKLGDMLLL